MRKNELKSLLPTPASTARGIASETDALLQRPELLCTLHGGYQMNSGDWTDREYAIGHPVYRRFGSHVGTFVDRICQPSKPLRSIDFACQISGLYWVDTYSEDETYHDTREKSIKGRVALQGRVWQQNEGSDSWTLKANTGVLYEPLHYVLTNQSGSCHFLYVSRLQIPFYAANATNFVYREGMLDLHGRATDYGAWDDIVINLEGLSSLDWTKPFRLTLDVETHFGPLFSAHEEEPYWLDESLASTLGSDSDYPDMPDREKLYLKMVGFSAWGKP